MGKFGVFVYYQNDSYPDKRSGAEGIADCFLYFFLTLFSLFFSLCLFTLEDEISTEEESWGNPGGILEESWIQIMIQPILQRVKIYENRKSRNTKIYGRPESGMPSAR